MISLRTRRLPCPRVRLRCAGALPLIFCLLHGSADVAAARPEYARKENKACAYCHLSATPNALNPLTNRLEPTARNPRGLYYAAHDHSFAGYSELAVMGKNAAPVFHLAWKEELTDKPRRAMVGDVVGDGVPRLVTLNEKAGNKDASVLTVKKWDGKAFVTEFAADAPSPADTLEVGRFAGAQRPAVILTVDALWIWEKGKLSRRPSAHPMALLGVTRLKSGEERVLVANSPTSVKAYLVDPDAPDGNFLKDGIDAPGSQRISWGDMHASPQFFIAMGLKEALGAGGLIGVWDPRKFGASFLYYAKIVPEFVTKPDPKSPNKTIYAIKNLNCYITFRDSRIRDNSDDSRTLSTAGEVWETPRLDGAPYDVALEDPKGGSKPGLLILVSDAADGKGRSLYFFALD